MPKAQKTKPPKQTKPKLAGAPGPRAKNNPLMKKVKAQKPMQLVNGKATAKRPRTPGAIGAASGPLANNGSVVKAKRVQGQKQAKRGMNTQLPGLPGTGGFITGR